MARKHPVRKKVTPRGGKASTGLGLGAPSKDRRRLTVLDLFAGCGGLSLGLEEAGFESVGFCELNDDARATYRMNRVHLPRQPKECDDVYTLLANDAAMLNAWQQDWKSEGIDRVDLVAGGPPCQGYSGIGHRRSYKVEKEEIPSNHLFKTMVEVIRRLQPRMFLFENVKGILSGRWTSGGKKGEIFADVLAAFRDIRAADGKPYSVRWSLVHAKDYGVPQNRPRVLLVGYHPELGWEPAEGETHHAVEAGMLPAGSGGYPDLADVLGDLLDVNYEPGKTRRTLRYRTAAREGSFAAEMRQVPAQLRPTFRLTEHEYSIHSPKVIEKFSAIIAAKGDMERVPSTYHTKKFAQRWLPPVWDPRTGPTITATSLPDDVVHWCQPRILTVREWARLQSFPDWYQFSGPRTTGGLRRAGNPALGLWDREVPKYTQIGNAVPVRLARAVGQHLAQVLRSSIEHGA